MRRHTWKEDKSPKLIPLDSLEVSEVISRSSTWKKVENFLIKRVWYLTKFDINKNDDNRIISWRPNTTKVLLRLIQNLWVYFGVHVPWQIRTKLDCLQGGFHSAWFLGEKMDSWRGTYFKCFWKTLSSVSLEKADGCNPWNTAFPRSRVTPCYRKFEKTRFYPTHQVVNKVKVGRFGSIIF